MTRHFLDVAAVRIQTWLGRSRTLAGRRGASAALAQATAPAMVRKLLDGYPAVVNPDAGHVDGVVNIELADPATAEAVARVCLGYLRQRLPALEFMAAWGSGADYLSAYKNGIKPNRLAQRVLLDLPVVADFPPLASCSLCRAAAAALDLRVDGDDERVCIDCAMRYASGRHTVGGAEARLRDALDMTDGDHVTYASTFADLARLPVVAAAGHEAAIGDTQLATVYADGNAVGALLDHVADRGEAGGKAELARAVTDANADSLAEATLEIWATDRSAYLPLAPHVVAGDDVLVSLPAAAAWRFTVVYATTYTRKLADLAKRWDAPATPSVSAGIVIAHCTHPFAETVALAETLLRQAKSAVHGREASLAWVDVTTDGPAPVAGRPVIAVADLGDDARLSTQLRALAAVEASQRATLAALTAAPSGRGDTAGPDAVSQDARTASQRLRDQVTRLGLNAIVDPFLEPAANPAGMRLPDALSLARWYR